LWKKVWNGYAAGFLVTLWKSFSETTTLASVKHCTKWVNCPVFSE